MTRELRSNCVSIAAHPRTAHFDSFKSSRSRARLVAMRSFTNPGFLAAIPLIAIGIAAQAQDSHGHRTLEVNGHTGQAIVYQISGKSYVDLESLARIANGSLSFRGGGIVVHLPAADAASHGQQTSTIGMTNDFMKASLQALASLNEWTHILSHEIQRGLPIHPSTMVALRNKASDQLRIATIDAANESDDHALRLLTLHFNQVDNWNNKLAAERKTWIWESTRLKTRLTRTRAIKGSRVVRISSRQCCPVDTSRTATSATSGRVKGGRGGVVLSHPCAILPRMDGAPGFSLISA